MTPRDPYANVSWQDAMRNGAPPKRTPEEAREAWSKRFHYMATATLVCGAMLGGYAIGMGNVVTRIETRVVQPKVYRADVCRPMGDVIGGGTPLTDDDAARRLMNAHALPLDPKERIAERNAWSRVESARIKGSNDLAREHLKSQDRRLQIFSKPSSASKGERARGSVKSNDGKSLRYKHESEQYDDGGGMFLDHSQW